MDYLKVRALARLSLLFLLLSVPGLASAETTPPPFSEGVVAYQRGDYRTAVSIFRPLADQGDAAVQFILGVQYAAGRGVVQDYAEAARWYRRAADQGDAAAQGDLGTLYANGQGVGRDYAEAVRWFRKAANQGDTIAQTNLGFLYANGQGVTQDYAEAEARTPLGEAVKARRGGRVS